MKFEHSSKSVRFCNENPIPEVPKANIDIFANLRPNVVKPSLPQKLQGDYLTVKQLKGPTLVDIKIPKIQPQQTIFISESLFISAFEEEILHADVKIYSHNLPTPK